MRIAVLGATGVVGQEILPFLSSAVSRHLAAAARFGAVGRQDHQVSRQRCNGRTGNPRSLRRDRSGPGQHWCHRDQILTAAVAPIHRAVGVRRLVVSTYQSASGAGLAAMEELQLQTREILDGTEPTPKALPHPIAFNVFSHNTASGPRDTTAKR